MGRFTPSERPVSPLHILAGGLDAMSEGRERKEHKRRNKLADALELARAQDYGVMPGAQPQEAVTPERDVLSGARPGMAGQQQAAVSFVRRLAKADIPRIAIENPVSILSSAWRKPDQVIQPWQFGHGETKAICLWLVGLPKLVASDVVDGREARVHRMAPGPDRWKDRSRFYPGVAAAMARQWS